MLKLKNILRNIYGDTKDKQNGGSLETDAVPVPVNENDNSNGSAQEPHSVSSTPTVSAEMTAAAIRELSDDNYNSMEAVPAIRNNALAVRRSDDDNNIVSALPTNATTNVHSAQQQTLIQLSHVSDVHFGSVYNFNNNFTAAVSLEKNAVVGPINTERQPRRTTTIVAMMQSQEEPSHRMLDTIATHLGEGWKQVMRDLDHSEGQIEQAIIDHQIHGNIKEVIYQLLLQWLRNADDDVATLGHITKLLWQRNHRDCVQRMKNVYKSNLVRKTST